MNCLDYVLSKLTKQQSEILKDALIDKVFFKDKSSLRKEDIIVFSHGFHVGFGVIGEYCEVLTDECSNNQIIHRHLDLYDERLKVVIVSPKLKRGSVITCQN